ncbi:MAG TPA: hypothetical protein VK789_23960 [Bryobacteraceae bacterium]|jgi:hypothetical protein|nr:hypothetical protein [Bryobacteraceae bacterium]
MNRLFVLAFILCGRLGAAAVDSGAATAQDFEKKVSAYVDLRKSVESNLPPLKSTPSPEKISGRQHQLADGIREARKNARPGDLFTPPVADEFRRLIRIAMEAGGPQIQASLRHAEPVKVKLHVNDSYPDHIPLQSTPPSLLANLPQLPQQIEYRLAGTDLILLDVRANLVVDLLERVIP